MTGVVVCVGRLLATRGTEDITRHSEHADVVGTCLSPPRLPPRFETADAVRTRTLRPEASSSYYECAK